MVIVDCALLLCGFALCIFTAHSDATRGIVENRLMLVGFTAAVILDACAYILIAPWLGITFLTNAVIAIVVSIFLYMANVWAGGDCKLFVVLSLLLPAADYLMIGECLLGSIPILMVAFILGYVQIVWMGLRATVKQGTYFLATDVFGAFLHVLRYWLTCLLLMNLLRFFCLLIAPTLFIQFPFITGLFSVIASVCVLTIEVLRSSRCLLAGFILLLLFGTVCHATPILASPASVVIILAMGASKVIASRACYIQVPCSEIKKGDILSTASSIMLSVKLPKLDLRISKEGPFDRLDEIRAEGLRTWGVGKGRGVVVDIVRKVPFALFMDTGFVAAALLGMIQRCYFM